MSSFQLKDIFKFLFDYLKLYKESHSSFVEKWSKDDLEKALRWSTTCEELIKKLEKSVKKAEKDDLKKVTEQLKVLAKHFELNESSNCEDLVKNAKRHMKHVSGSQYC
jgi:hypothetical protein